MKCKKHHVPMVCPKCMSAAGGKRSSPAKTAAARENWKRAQEVMRVKRSEAQELNEVIQSKQEKPCE